MQSPKANLEAEMSLTQTELEVALKLGLEKASGWDARRLAHYAFLLYPSLRPAEKEAA